MGPMSWAMVLLGLAVALAILDLFIPSHGLLVFAAAVCAVIAIGMGFSVGVRQGAMLIAVVGFLTPVLATLMLKWWPHTPVGRRVMLSRPENPDELLPEWDQELLALVGRVGTAKTDLLPNGCVVIDGRNWDALTEGKAIDQGSPVKVTAVRNGRLLVQPALPEDLASLSAESDEQALLSQPVEEWEFEDDPE